VKLCSSRILPRPRILQACCEEAWRWHSAQAAIEWGKPRNKWLSKKGISSGRERSGGTRSTKVSGGNKSPDEARLIQGLRHISTLVAAMTRAATFTGVSRRDGRRFCPARRAGAWPGNAGEISPISSSRMVPDLQISNFPG